MRTPGQRVGARPDSPWGARLEVCPLSLMGQCLEAELQYYNAIPITPSLPVPSSTPSFPTSLPSSPLGKASGIPRESSCVLHRLFALCLTLPPLLPIWLGQSPTKLSSPGPWGSPGRKDCKQETAFPATLRYRA